MRSHTAPSRPGLNPCREVGTHLPQPREKLTLYGIQLLVPSRCGHRAVCRTDSPLFQNQPHHPGLIVSLRELEELLSGAADKVRRAKP